MADGGASFAVTLVNQVTAPARAIQQSMRGVAKAVGDAKRVIDAPAPRRGALSDWDKMLSKAKGGQAADFARNQAKLVRAKDVASAKALQRSKAIAGHQKMMQSRMAQHHADHSMGAGLAGASEGAAMSAIAGVAVAAIAAAAAVAYLSVKFAETAFEAGRFAESSTKAIGFLTDNAQHAGVVFDDVRHLAQSLGLGVEDTVHSFQKLLAAQFTVGQSKDLVRMVADLQAIGASAEEAQGILLAMSQIKSKGRLQAQEMLQLQERGVSAELVYAALGKTLGKTRAEVMKLQTAGKIGGDVAIEAIKSAVMSKTHENKLGDVGANRANTTVSGMLGQAGAGLENFWIDVGQKMLPGATRVMKLIAGTIGKISDDPKVAELGTFLLAKWEKFTNWVSARWPDVEGTLVGGLHLVADGIMWVTDALTISDTKWDAIKGTVMLAAYAFGALTIAGFLLMLPLLLLIGLVAVVIVALGMLTSWVVDQAQKWYESGQNMVKGLITGILSQLGPLGQALAVVASLMPSSPKQPGDLVPIPGMQQPYTTIAPDMSTGGGLPSSSGIGSALSALSGTGSGKTEGGTEAGPNRVHIGEMPIHVTAAAGEDPNTTGAKIGAAVRAEVAKVLRG